MTFIDLCAGIGGISLGLEHAGMTCVGQVEIDPWRRAILDKYWPHVPKWEDIYDFDPGAAGPATLVAGGYPCQPFSLSGKRQGAKDDRHLWPRVFGIVEKIQPTWCLFENVVGHISMGLDIVCADLEGAGYDVQPVVLPACAVDAKHIRARIWILAHTAGNEFQRRALASTSGSPKPREEQLAGFLFSGARASVSGARAVGDVYGVSGRMDNARRNEAIGGAVVPQVVEVIGRAILAAEEEFA